MAKPSRASARPSKSIRNTPMAYAQPRHRPAATRRSWTRPSPPTARPSSSTRNTPSPTTTSASPCATRRSWTRPSPRYRKAIELDPKYAEAHYNLGIALSEQKEAGRGHRRLPQGHRTRPETTPTPTSTSASPCSPEEAGRGHRRLPQGHRHSTRQTPAPTAISAALLADQKKWDEAIAGYPQGHRARPEILPGLHQPRRRPVAQNRV